MKATGSKWNSEWRTRAQLGLGQCQGQTAQINLRRNILKEVLQWLFRSSSGGYLVINKTNYLGSKVLQEDV